MQLLHVATEPSHITEGFVVRCDSKKRPSLTALTHIHLERVEPCIQDVCLCALQQPHPERSNPVAEECCFAFRGVLLCDPQPFEMP